VLFVLLPLLPLLLLMSTSSRVATINFHTQTQLAGVAVGLSLERVWPAQWPTSDWIVNILCDITEIMWLIKKTIIGAHFYYAIACFYC